MDKFKWGKKYLYWGVTAFLVVAACITFFWFIQRWEGVRNTVSNINSILTPFILGAVIAYFLTPAVKFFQKRITGPIGSRIIKKHPERADGFARGLAVSLVLLLFLGLITALFILVLPQLYRSIESIVLNLSGSISKVEAWAQKWLEDYPELEAAFTEFVGDIGTAFADWAKETLMPSLNSILTSVSVGVLNIIKALANFVVALVVSVYAMHSREKFVAQGKKVLYGLLPVRISNRILGVLRFTDKSFMSFFSGQLLDSLIVGIICYIGCMIIGIKDSVLISVIIGITNIIPFFGPFIGAIPSALIVLMSSPLQCLIFLIFIVVLQQFDGNILSPKILGSTIGISGFWVMFSILLGSGLLGPIGMIIGVPLFAVIYAAVKYLIGKRLKKRGLPEETDAYAALDHIDLHTQGIVTITEKKEKLRKLEEMQEKEAEAFKEEE